MSYTRGIHQVTMIHIIYTLIDAILAKWCICNGSGVYVIYTTCASIGQWLPLVYVYILCTSAWCREMRLMTMKDLARLPLRCRCTYVSARNVHRSGTSCHLVPRRASSGGKKRQFCLAGMKCTKEKGSASVVTDQSHTSGCLVTSGCC